MADRNILGCVARSRDTAGVGMVLIEWWDRSERDMFVAQLATGSWERHVA